MIPVRKSKVTPPPADCPLSECMRYLGRSWTPHIIWYLRATPRRFNELKGDLKGISAKMLATRLRELQEAGVVLRSEMNTSPPTVEYCLTELGQQLHNAIEGVVSVGRQLKLRRRAA